MLKFFNKIIRFFKFRKFRKQYRNLVDNTLLLEKFSRDDISYSDYIRRYF